MITIFYTDVRSDVAARDYSRPSCEIDACALMEKQQLLLRAKFTE